MKKEDLENLTNGIKKKLGKETSALINDDLATIILDNTSTNEELINRQNQIDKLKQEKDDLIITNTRLFQQVTVGEEPEKKTPAEDKKEPFNFRSVFDEKGNFI